MRKVDGRGKQKLFRCYVLFRRVICCSGGLYGCQGGLCTDQRDICCSGGLYAVQEGYINVQEGCILFRGVICCSGGLYGCPEGLYVKSISLKEGREGKHNSILNTLARLSCFGVNIH